MGIADDNSNSLQKSNTNKWFSYSSQTNKEWYFESKSIIVQILWCASWSDDLLDNDLWWYEEDKMHAIWQWSPLNTGHQYFLWKISSVYLAVYLITSCKQIVSYLWYIHVSFILLWHDLSNVKDQAIIVQSKYRYHQTQGQSQIWYNNTHDNSDLLMSQALVSE